MDNDAATPEKNNTEDGLTPAVGKDGAFYCLSICGLIEGHYTAEQNQKSTKYDQVIPPRAVSAATLMRLRSEVNGIPPNLRNGQEKPTVSVVLGGGHSIGVPLAVCARRSFIVPSATMTIHPVRTTGMVLGVPQAFDYLNKMQDRIIRFITAHSSVSEENFRTMLSRTDALANDIGTILNGWEAVECGLIDEIGGIAEALSALRKMKNDAV